MLIIEHEPKVLRMVVMVTRNNIKYHAFKYLHCIIRA